jgi:site-specific DNA-methyltransferase (adenine-specific)
MTTLHELQARRAVTERYEAALLRETAHTHTDAAPPTLALGMGTPQVGGVYNLDIFDLCAGMGDASVDMILCDLPYESLEVGWDRLIPVVRMWEQFKRLIKPRGAIVLTSKQPFSSLLIFSNLPMYRYSWYWEKSRGANVAQTGYRPLAVIEEALVFSHSPAVFSNMPTMNYYPQGDRLENPYKRAHKAHHTKITANSVGSPMRNPERGIGERTYEYTTPRNLLYVGDDPERGLHPTQKPVKLFSYLIRTYTQPGELVFDPTCGSGTTALAAREEGRRFIVGDSSAHYVDIARRRLAQPYTPNMFAAQAS